MSTRGNVDIKNLLICGCGKRYALRCCRVAIKNSGCRVSVYTPFVDEATRFNETVRHTGGIRTCGCSRSPRCQTVYDDRRCRTCRPGHGYGVDGAAGHLPTEMS